MGIGFSSFVFLNQSYSSKRLSQSYEKDHYSSRIGEHENYNFRLMNTIQGIIISSHSHLYGLFIQITLVSFAMQYLLILQSCLFSIGEDFYSNHDYPMTKSLRYNFLQSMKIGGTTKTSRTVGVYSFIFYIELAQFSTGIYGLTHIFILTYWKWVSNYKGVFELIINLGKM